MKRPIPIRIDEQDIDALKKLGVSVPELVRKAIREELNKQASVCKCCGGKGVKHG